MEPMNRLWSCHKCTADMPPSGDEIKPHKGYSFQAPKPDGRAAPACPRCGLDGGEPDLAGWIVPLVVTHYEAPHPAGIPNRGCGRVACSGVNPRTARVHTTGEPRLVLCEACRATPAHRAAMSGFENPAEYHMPPAPTPTVEG